MDKSKKSYKKKRQKRLNNFKQRKQMEKQQKKQIGIELQPDAKVTLDAPEINAIMQFANMFRSLVVVSDIIAHKLTENGGLKPVYDESQIVMEKSPSSIVDINGNKMESEVPDSQPTEMAMDTPVGHS